MLQRRKATSQPTNKLPSVLLCFLSLSVLPAHSPAFFHNSPQPLPLPESGMGLHVRLLSGHIRKHLNNKVVPESQLGTKKTSSLFHTVIENAETVSHTYFTYAHRSRWSLGPSTTPRHRTLFWAALTIPDQLVPCCFSSASVSRLQLLRGRPLFLFPCDSFPYQGRNVTGNKALNNSNKNNNTFCPFARKCSLWAVWEAKETKEFKTTYTL